MAVEQILDAQAISGQLERILASPVFKSSKRTSLLLRFIVARTLEGQTNLLKERVLGTEVFGRSSNYDTGSDHIVRSTAGEIRKRLAQYYLNPESDAEIRIEVLAGSYVPQFRTPEPRQAEHALEVETLPLPAKFEQRSQPRRQIAIGLAAAFALALFVWPAAHFISRGNAVRRFWSTLLDSDIPITISVGDPKSSWSGSEADAFRDFPFSGGATHPARLFSLLSGKAGVERMVYGPESTLSDLRQNSAVLVGGIDNFWSMSLTRDLRYRFQLDSSAKHLNLLETAGPMRLQRFRAISSIPSGISVGTNTSQKFGWAVDVVGGEA